MADDDKKNKEPKVIGDYRIGKVLGTGSYGYVRLGSHTGTQEQFAIKTLKDNHNKKGIRREIAILKLLDHPNIVKLHDVIEEQKSGVFYLVLELAGGGELFDYIVARGKLREKEARRFFRQIISGVEYCHANLVIHRDLKPENLLLDLEGNIKINDFGFSNILVPGERFDTFCGSVSYVAPEIIKNIKYAGPEIDVWSMGVILYTLVCGRLPWPETADGSPCINNILDGDYDRMPLQGVSEGCRDLIAQILVPNPVNRATLSTIRTHPWVNEGYSSFPPCLVQSYPPITEVHPEILEQIVKAGFGDPHDVQSKLLSGDTCMESAIYNLLLKQKEPKQERLSPKIIPASSPSRQLLEQQAAAEERDPGGRRSTTGGSFLMGSGAAQKWHQRKTKRGVSTLSVSTSASTSYSDTGKTALEGIQAAISTSADNIIDDGSPTPVRATGRRYTVTSDGEAGYSPVAGNGNSISNPTSPVTSTRPPRTSLSGSQKRKSLIFSIKEKSFFKNLFKPSEKVREVKGVFNVDTTTTQPPIVVMIEIKRVLEEESVNSEEFKLVFKEKGYVFKCKYPNQQRLKFTMEVCKIKKLSLTGIKLKRIRGDLWVYKEHCQRLLAKMKM